MPLYAVTEAARIVDVPKQTLSRWARHYALITYAQPDGPRRPSIPFVGLAEAVVLSALRRTGVPMQRIRPDLQSLDDQMRIDHALASKRLYSDGAELLFDYTEKHFGSRALGSRP